MLIWLINSLGAHRHKQFRVKPSEEETGVIQNVSSISLVGNSTGLTGSSLVLFSSRNIQFEERVWRHLLKSHKAA